MSDGNVFFGYLNGKLILQRQSSTPFKPAGNGERYYFWKDTFGGEEEDFVGQMDEIRIWNKALSAEEIKAGLPQRLAWRFPNLVALVNSDTDRVKAVAGQRNRLFLAVL